MNTRAKQFLYGFLSWFVPFAVAIPLYPLVQSGNQNYIYFFKSIMIVLGTGVGVWLFFLYFKIVENNFFINGLITGIIWFAFNIILDLIVLVHMFESPLLDWIMGVGIRYINIILIGAGFGAILDKKK